MCMREDIERAGSEIQNVWLAMDDRSESGWHLRRSPTYKYQPLAAVSCTKEKRVGDLMACIDMFNTDHQTSLCAPMSPRISFSNDFADADHHLIKHERAASAPPPSTDFEFSVTSYRMIAADEIFFKGRLMPLKENCTAQLQKLTLRDELMHDDDDVSPTRTKGPVRWKELLGLKKGPSFGKKHEKIDSPLEQPAERKSPTNTAPAVETARVSKDVENHGGPRFLDMHI